MPWCWWLYLRGGLWTCSWLSMLLCSALRFLGRFISCVSVHCRGSGSLGPINCSGVARLRFTCSSALFVPPLCCSALVSLQPTSSSPKSGQTFAREISSVPKAFTCFLVFPSSIILSHLMSSYLDCEDHLIFLLHSFVWLFKCPVWFIALQRVHWIFAFQASSSWVDTFSGSMRPQILEPVLHRGVHFPCRYLIWSYLFLTERLIWQESSWIQFRKDSFLWMLC